MKLLARSISLFSALLGLALASGPGLYRGGSKVINLTDQNIEKLLRKSEAVWVVKFYAPWCGHCRQMQPEFAAAAQMMNGIIKFGAVNCEDNKSNRFCQQYHIQAYPTVYLFGPEKEQKEQPFEQFRGRHDRQSLVNFGLQYLPEHFVQQVNDHSYESFLSEQIQTEDGTTTLPKCLLFTQKSTTTAMYKSLALNLKDRMRFAEARHGGGTKALYAAFPTVKKLATLMVITDSGEEVIYSGPLVFPEVLAFLKKHAVVNPDEISHYQTLGVEQEATEAEIKKAYRKLSVKYHPDKNAGDKATQLKFEAVAAAYEVLSDDNARSLYDQELDGEGGVTDADFYTRNRDIENIQSFGHFQQIMNSGHGVVIVEFYTPWCEPCVQFSAQFKKLPGALENRNLDKKVKIAAVNCERQQQTCHQLGVQSYPSVLMFKENDGGYEKYGNKDMSAEGVAAWISDSIDSAVVEIGNRRHFEHMVDRGNEVVLVDFSSPRCGPCNAIKGDVRRMANSFTGLAKVAIFNCQQSHDHQQLCNERGVRGYPTIMVFPKVPPASGREKRGEEIDVTGNQHGAIEAMTIARTVLKMASDVPQDPSDAPEMEREAGDEAFDHDDI